MTVVKTMAEINDGALLSTGQEPTDGTWQTPFMKKARQGNNVVTDPSNDPISGARMAIGGHMDEAPGNHLLHLFQTWMEFTPEKGFKLFADEELVSASLRMSLFGNQVNRGDAESFYNFTGPTTFPLGSGSWRDMEALRDNPNYDFEYQWIHQGPLGILMEAGGEVFLTNVLNNLASGVNHQHMITTWSALRDFPGGTTYKMYWIRAANSPGVSDHLKPYLILRTQKKHALNAVGGSSIQMTDGTAVFLRLNRATQRVGLYYQRPHQTSATLIGLLPASTADRDVFYQVGAGFQTFSITRDSDNNIYVAGMRGNAQSAPNVGARLYNVNAFKYNGNYSWHQWSPSSLGEMPSVSSADLQNRGMPNNFSCVWVPGSSKNAHGQLVVVHSRRDAQWGRYQLGANTMSAGWLFGESTDKGSAYSAPDLLASDSSTQWRSWNSTGTGLDALPDYIQNVRFAGFIQGSSGSDNGRSAVGGFYAPASHIVGRPGFPASTIVNDVPHDPDAKMRMPWMGNSDEFYTIARHGMISVHRRVDDVLYQQIDLSAQGLTNFPSRAELQKSQAWDILVDSVAMNWFWFYYRDSTNPRLLRKVRWNFQTNELDNSFQFTPTPLGPSGSSILAIRTPRQKVDTRCVLVDVAMQDGAGAPLDLITLRDTSMNYPPSPPILDPVSYVNATTNVAINWEFRDFDLSDFPTAQDVEIRRVNNGLVVHTATKAAPVASGPKWRYVIPANTLVNDTAYQIRIRAYDSVDAQGEWSEWFAFTTSGTGGTVTITEPPADATTNSSSVLIKWTYANTTPSVIQNGYRIRVYNDATNALFSDTALVNSTATERLITGLWSGLRFRIEVSVLDSNNQMSGSGVRVITPDYNDPTAPTIKVEKHPGFLRIRPNNPAPTGENPATTENQIARKESGEDDSAYLIIGTCPPNGIFDDWTVASGKTYIYKARGIA